jgi:hypothetical protein
MSSLTILPKWSHLLFLFLTLIKYSPWFFFIYLKYITFLFFSQQTEFDGRDIIWILSVINTTIKLSMLQNQF